MFLLHVYVERHERNSFEIEGTVFCSSRRRFKAILYFGDAGSDHFYFKIGTILLLNANDLADRSYISLIYDQIIRSLAFDFYKYMICYIEGSGQSLHN